MGTYSGARGYYNILETLRDELESNNSITTITKGDITEISRAKADMFPLAHIIVNTCTLVNQIYQWNITVMCMDIIDINKDATVDVFRGNDNQDDILNTQLAVCSRLAEKFRSGSLHQDGFQLLIGSDPILEPFYDRFEHKLVGWAMTFDVVSQNNINIC